MLNFAFANLKSAITDVFGSLFTQLLKRITDIGIPYSDTSDIEKSQI